MTEEKMLPLRLCSALDQIISDPGDETESARAVSTVKLGLADDDSVFLLRAK
jgi:hypothetical protein